MKHILKWHGSKGSELDIIKQNIPLKITRFVEPFLGSGALYFSLEHKINIVNDFHKELMEFYTLITKETDFLIFNLDLFQSTGHTYNIEKSLPIDNEIMLKSYVSNIIRGQSNEI